MLARSGSRSIRPFSKSIGNKHTSSDFIFELTFSKDWVLRKGPVFGLTIEATIEFLSAVGDFDRSLTL